MNNRGGAGAGLRRGRARVDANGRRRALGARERKRRNDFGPEAVGAAARGCNPAAIRGVRETDAALLVPAAALDAARPAFARWAGPKE